jgi:hypothetical protein
MAKKKVAETLIVGAEKQDFEGSIIVTTVVDGSMFIPHSEDETGRSLYETKLRCSIPAEQVSMVFANVLGSYLTLRIVPKDEAREYMLQAGLKEEDLQ